MHCAFGDTRSISTWAYCFTSTITKPSCSKRGYQWKQFKTLSQIYFVLHWSSLYNLCFLLAQALEAKFDQVARAGSKTQAIDLDVPNQPPPPELSKKAVENRLRRLMTPRADGSLLVHQELQSQWKDLFTREKVMALFEKCGYSPDQGSHVCVGEKLFQPTNEPTSWKGFGIVMV